VSLTEDNRFYSQDHGHFLPSAPHWDMASLRANVDAPHECGADGAGLDFIEIQRLADRLDLVSRDELLEALIEVPRSWNHVSDEELEHVGAFLESRAPAVALRLRARLGGHV
jgi:hypothetical protein